MTYGIKLKETEPLKTSRYNYESGHEISDFSRIERQFENYSDKKKDFEANRTSERYKFRDFSTTDNYKDEIDNEIDPDILWYN
ncbi:MAG: hypothetical protein PHV18_15105 [Lachnospiraceae bacterium]|nr:hypothetical protein [Lachnospiraceae bacterium]